MILRVWSLVARVLSLVIFLTSCASTTNTTSTSNTPRYSVGPGSTQNSPSIEAASEEAFLGYNLILTPFDPGIPADSNQFEELGIWPELRRTEAVRFPVELQKYLVNKSTIAKARIAPNMSAVGHFYLNGEIKKSNGEDVELQITLTDISGREKMDRSYRFRVGGYDDPRNTSANKYTPILVDIADDIDRALRRVRSRERDSLVAIEKLRFAEAFQPQYFSQFLRTVRGRTRLLGVPDENDPEFERINVIYTKDDLFLDSVQKDYDDFFADSNAPYNTWQEQAYVESKARREAASAARAKLIGGLIVAAVGVAALGDTTAYSPEAYTAAAAAVAGAAVALDSSSDFKDAKTHVDSLNEIGRSVNADLAPRVMDIEDREVELTGTAEEQYAAWREYLKQIYIVERTPNVEL